MAPGALVKVEAGVRRYDFGLAALAGGACEDRFHSHKDTEIFGIAYSTCGLCQRKSVSDYRFPNSGPYNPDTSEEPMKRSLIAGLMLVVFGVSGNIARAQGGSSCDRECLRGFVTQYLNAMVAHNPAALTTAPNVRFTEDTQTLKLGEGLWKNANAIRPYRQDFIDVRESTAVSHIIVEEGGMPVMLALRLKIADKKITEVETMVTRNREQGAIFNVNALQTPRPAMSNPVDPSQAHVASGIDPHQRSSIRPDFVLEALSKPSMLPSPRKPTASKMGR